MAWKKGQSGNPHGRPENAKPVTQMLTSALNEAHESGDKTKMRAVIDAWIKAAIAGELPAIVAIADRIDGKPAQTIDANLNDDRSPRDLTGTELDSRITDVLTRIEALTGGAAGQEAGQNLHPDVRKLN